MFFTRSQDERVRKLENEVASLTTRIASASENEARLLSIIEAQQDTHFQTIGKQHELQMEHQRSFQRLADQYSDGLERARRTIKELEAEAAKQAAQPTFRNEPLHISEEQEDLEYQRERGLISPAEYEDILKEAGFENPTIRLQ